MAGETSQTAPRPRLWRRVRIPDLLMAGFLVLLAAAIVVNGIADVHDTRRARLDKKVAARWFRTHPQLGQFGPPVVKVHRHVDIACASRRPPAGQKIPVDGWCVWITDSSPKSTAIERSHQCLFVRPHLVRPPGMPTCPKAHSNP